MNCQVNFAMNHNFLKKEECLVDKCTLSYHTPRVFSVCILRTANMTGLVDLIFLKMWSNVRLTAVGMDCLFRAIFATSLKSADIAMCVCVLCRLKTDCVTKLFFSGAARMLRLGF